MMRKTALFTLIFSIIFLASVTPLAYAEQGAACKDCVQEQLIYGTPTPLTLEFNYPLIKGGYVANGTCMRNYGYGTIDIMGVPANSYVVQAFLYWEILNSTRSPRMANASFESTPITGTLIANPGEPCWAAGYAWVYRADVTSLIKPGINGAYSLTGFPSGVTDGSDPWLFYTTPLLEGASLVIVYSNPSLPLRTVQVYDGGVTFTAQTVETKISDLEATPIGKTPNAKTTYIVGDGQIHSVTSPSSASWNGVTIISPEFRGGDVVDSTGARDTTDGWLWDTVTAEVTISPGAKSAIADVSSGTEGFVDCITWVAQVVQVDVIAQPVGGELVLPSTPSIILMASLAIACVLVVLASSKLRKRPTTSRAI